MLRMLYIVCSPLQALNAIEAAYRFNINGVNDLIICKSKENNNNKQLNEVIKTATWNCVTFLSNIPLIRLMQLFWFFKKLKNNKYDNIFIGEPFSDILARYGELISYNKNVIYMDDGLSTLIFVRNVNEATLSSEKNKSKASYFKGQKNNYQFFSAFSKAFANVEGIKLIAENDYRRTRYLKSLLDKKIIKQKKAYIIGDNLVESGMCDFHKYLKLIKKLIASIEDSYDIVYLPHRRESSKNYQQLCALCGIKAMVMNKPIEIEFLQYNLIECIFFGFQSTALVTMPMLYPEVKFKICRYPSEINFESQVFNRELSTKIEYFKNINCPNITIIDLCKDKEK